MIKTSIIHPILIGSLAAAGHGDRILLADSNYPSKTHKSLGAEIIYLNLAAGILSIIEILPFLLEEIQVEAATYMCMESGLESPIISQYRSILPKGLPMLGVERQVFYDTASSQSTSLVIVSGEQRLYANLLLTVGVVAPENN